MRGGGLEAGGPVRITVIQERAEPPEVGVVSDRHGGQLSLRVQERKFIFNGF